MGRQRRRVIARRKYHCGLTPGQVAEHLGISERSYRAFEAGDSMLQDGRLPRLRSILDDWDAEEMRWAVDEGDVEPPNGQHIPESLNIFAGLEQGAAELWAYEPVTVYGLLQTADYADAVERSDALERTSVAIAERVELRMSRQRVLHREPDPLHLSVILDESVLHRTTGNEKVMIAQLRHLADSAELPNVDLYVLPLGEGQHSSGTGTFQLLTSAGSAAPRVVCIEDRTGFRYLEGAQPVGTYARVFEHLRACSLSPAESTDLIRRVAKEAQP